MLDDLRHFVAVAESGTFTTAAKRVHLSQPALTASIQRLEADLGARLFSRGRRGAELTAAGDALLPHARAALAAVADGRRAVAEVEGLKAGRVRVGAGATYCTYVLPRLLLRFRDRYPTLSLQLREGHSAELIDALVVGELDLAVLPAEQLPPGLVAEPWGDDELVLVGAPNASPKLPFVAFSRPSPTRALLDQLFPDAEIVMELNSIAAVKGNVRGGVGRALVSRVAVAHDLTEGRMVLLPDSRVPVTRRISLVHRGVERLPPAAGALRALLMAAKDVDSAP